MKKKLEIPGPVKTILAILFALLVLPPISHFCWKLTIRMNMAYSDYLMEIDKNVSTFFSSSKNALAGDKSSSN